MKNPISVLTYKIVSKTAIKDFNYDDVVDWAMDLLSKGNESPTILILSGLSKPTNYFEVHPYLEKAFEELNLKFIEGEEAKISYAKYLMIRMSEKDSVKSSLATLYSLFELDSEVLEVNDFIMLYWAWDELHHGFQRSDYWIKANRDTIENIVVEKAKKWVQENIKN